MPKTDQGFRSEQQSPDKAVVDGDNFYELYYRHLVGCTITAVGKNADGYHYFVAKRGDIEFTCDISQDEEGNGPGFLFGLPNSYAYYEDIN